MNEDTNVQGTEQPGAAENETHEEEKTFTQEEVDRIVEKRLSRERKKFASVLDGKDPREAELEERERAVAIKELQADAKGTLKAKGLPVEALKLLNYTDKESCDKSIELLGMVMDRAYERAASQILRGGPPIKRAPEEDTGAAAVRRAFGLK